MTFYTLVGLSYKITSYPKPSPLDGPDNTLQILVLSHEPSNMDLEPPPAKVEAHDRSQPCGRKGNDESIHESIHVSWNARERWKKKNGKKTGKFQNKAPDKQPSATVRRERDLDPLPDMVTMDEYPMTGGNDAANRKIMITGGPLNGRPIIEMQGFLRYHITDNSSAETDSVVNLSSL